MKNLLTLLFTIPLYFNVHAQKVELFSEVNFGVSTHLSLKEFHNDLAEEIPFNNIKTTDNFKFDYGVTFGVKFNSINTSFFYNTRVSGAKSSLVDYSGHIKLTNELQGSTFGVKYEFYLKKYERGNLLLGIKGLITSSKLILKSESKLLGVEENDNFNFKSLDFGTGVALAYEYQIKFITFRAHLDFDFYLGGDLEFEEIDDAHLLNKDGGKVTSGWTGLNAGIGISIPLIK